MQIFLKIIFVLFITGIGAAVTCWGNIVLSGWSESASWFWFLFWFIEILIILILSIRLAFRKKDSKNWGIIYIITWVCAIILSGYFWMITYMGITYTEWHFFSVYLYIFLILGYAWYALIQNGRKIIKSLKTHHTL